jgi:hypothetical protein
MNPNHPSPDPLYATGWSGPLPPAKPRARRLKPGTTAHALRDLSTLRAEQERRWDADRAGYGQSMPAYYKPKDFDPGGWERYVADHPNAPNVVAWREQQEGATTTTTTVEPVEIESPSPPRLLQRDLF